MSLRDELRHEAKRLVIDATYSSRGHFAQASKWGRWAVILGLPLAIVSGLSAAAAAVTAIFTNFRALTAGLALLSAVLTSVRGFLRPEESAETHGVKAARYLGIRNDASFFLRIDLNSDLEDAELTKRLRDLRKSYNDLTLIPPHVISTSAYQTAKKSIETGEAAYENDPLWAELDK
jgi:hypothetical protein